MSSLICENVDGKTRYLTFELLSGNVAHLSCQERVFSEQYLDNSFVSFELLLIDKYWPVLLIISFTFTNNQSITATGVWPVLYPPCTKFQ